MTAPAWPANIPQRPNDGGWSETNQRNVAEFQPEVGAPKFRRRSTAAGATASAGFTMTAAQLDDFDDFYADDCVDGTIPFTWAHPISGTTYSWVFTAPPERAAIDVDQFGVSVQLRRLP